MAYTTTAALGVKSGDSTAAAHLTPPFYADFMRENLYGSLYWRQLGTLVTIPRGRGTKARISRWKTPLKVIQGQMQISSAKMITAVEMHAEATAITPAILCAESITGEVTGWAGARGYTDKVVIVSMANFIKGALESLSRELAFDIDTYLRGKISANAFTHLAVQADGTVVTKVVGDCKLFGKNCGRIRPLMGANGVPTWDDGTYVGMAHELAAYDMFMDISSTGFISVARYNDARMIYRGEIGEFYGVRWLLSNASVPKLYGGPSGSATSATTTLSGGVTGSNAYVFGPDGFYNLELETGGVEVIHQPLGSAGTADAAAQLGSIAVKVYFGGLPAPAADYRIMRFIHALGLHY